MEIGAPELQIEHAEWKLKHVNMQIEHAPMSSRACECSDDPNGPPYLWATVVKVWPKKPSNKSFEFDAKCYRSCFPIEKTDIVYLFGSLIQLRVHLSCHAHFEYFWASVYEKMKTRIAGTVYSSQTYM